MPKKRDQEPNIIDALIPVHVLPKSKRQANPLYDTLIRHIVESKDNIIKIDATKLNLKPKTLLWTQEPS